MEKRGDLIPGSRFYRNFCSMCGEPMRVFSQDRLDENVLCLDCRTFRSPGAGSPHGWKEQDTSFDRAIRAIEDGR